MDIKTRAFLRRIPFLGGFFREANLDERLDGLCRFLEIDHGEKKMWWDVEEHPDGLFIGRIQNRDTVFMNSYSKVDRHTAKWILFVKSISDMDPEVLERKGLVERIVPERDLRTELLERISGGDIFLGGFPGGVGLWWAYPTDLPGGDPAVVRKSMAARSGSGRTAFDWNESEELAKMDALEWFRELYGIGSDEELALWLETQGK